MSGFLMSLCILAFLLLLVFLFFLIKGANDEEIAKMPVSVNRGELISSVKMKYIHAYEWAVKHLSVDTNALNEWKAYSEEKKHERFEYNLCYQVSRYSHYRPKNFPKMKNEVTNGSLYDCYNARNFMIEFIGIVEDLKKDHELVDLCDQYKVPVDFGVIGSKRKYDSRYSSYEGRWL
ncbi:hypothetical protein vB_AbaM_Acibel004_65 [Acinetobacter phage vB_AbaM_Acibel004]|uniref:hypothetical protein n=1 Tax=Acinetobacter phage vB_AbaM_Acibel004 TaxID=1481186 RepID=UPI0004E84D3D|nr:hypothetical protein vB_AbaM_Acibel004_65 [Acinetobacter phage vB_AbaM_Acibel004]AHY26680.1 hypothetical protein vB_AbaM_Acibel004_65 [Acinetobacter phage vB_AbaM_Acibel004]